MSSNKNRRLGVVSRSGADAPHRESKPSAHAPAPHARHDRSMARSCLVARMIFEEKSSLAGRRVQRPSGFASFSTTLMKRFLTKSWGEGTFKSRPNSFEACIVSSDRGHGIQRCDPRYNNKVSVNRWLILARNCKVSVTDCSIQQGIITFLWLIVDFTKELQGFPWEYEENLDPKRSQIGLRCSETKKCSQRFEIDHFSVRDLVIFSNSEILL